MTIRTITIGVSGDSLAFGYDGTNAHGDNRLRKMWSVKLLELLNSVHYPASFRLQPIDWGGFVNTGINSRFLADILVSEFEKFRPDIMINEGAINDYGRGDSNATVRTVRTALLAACKAKGIRSVVPTTTTGGWAISAPAKETERVAGNVDIRAGYYDDPGWVVHADPDGDTRLQTLGNTNWFQPSDIHLTETNTGTDIGGGNGVYALSLVAPVRALAAFVR